MSNTRHIDAEWLETECPECGHIYLWHYEEYNVCTRCYANYGKLVKITDLLKALREMQ